MCSANAMHMSKCDSHGTHAAARCRRAHPCGRGEHFSGPGPMRRLQSHGAPTLVGAGSTSLGQSPEQALTRPEDSCAWALGGLPRARARGVQPGDLNKLVSTCRRALKRLPRARARGTIPSARNNPPQPPPRPGTTRPPGPPGRANPAHFPTLRAASRNCSTVKEYMSRCTHRPSCRASSPSSSFSLFRR